MPEVIKKGKELIRICPTNTMKIEFSMDAGEAWKLRYMGNPASPGNFLDLEDGGKELLATTDKGTFYSKNKGKSWLKRG